MPAAHEDRAVGQALEMARRLTGMPGAYLAEFVGSEHVLRHIDGDLESLGLAVGHTTPLDRTLCHAVARGDLAPLVEDTRGDPLARQIAAQSETTLRSYIGQPVRVPASASVYGSMCCVDTRPRHDLGEHDVDLLEALAGFVGHHLGRRRARAGLRALDTVAASVAHDLQTPLMAMRFLGEDLVRGAADPVEAGEVLVQEADRTLAMVEELRDAALGRQRASRAPGSVVDLTALVPQAVRQVLTGTHRDAEGRLELDLPDEPVVVAVDADAAMRAVTNLLDNALKYAPVGPVHVSLRRRDGGARLSVADHGPGIAPDDLPHVAEPFFRAAGHEQDGMGLGLVSVEALVERHGGRLRIESEVGRGTTVTLELPLDP